MSPKGKNQPKGKSFRWNLETTKTLLNICIDYQKTNGVDQLFGWADISEKLGQKIGKKCSSASVKNKFDHLKKRWCLWKKLQQNETCIALNHAEGRIDADDAWWDRKIKENEQYQQFRKMGVPLEIDDLCKQIFRTGVTTRKHGVAPSRDPLEADEIETRAQSQSKANGGETESKAQSQSKVDGVENEVQSQSKEDGGEIDVQIMPLLQCKNPMPHSVAPPWYSLDGDGGETEAQKKRKLQQFNRIPIYHENDGFGFASTSVYEHDNGLHEFLANLIVDPNPATDGGETEAQAPFKVGGGEIEAQQKSMLLQDMHEFSTFLAKPYSEPDLNGGASRATQSNMVQSQCEVDKTEAEKHRMLQQEIRSSEVSPFLANPIVYSEPEVGSDPTWSNPIQSQSEADKGQTEAQKHRMLRNFLPPYPEPEVDGDATQSNMVQSQSEVERGDNEAQKHQMLQQEIFATDVRDFLANPIAYCEPEVDSGPTRPNMVQSQSRMDMGGAKAQSQSKADGGGAEAQSQSKADGGGAEVQSQSKADRGGTEAQSQSKSDGGGAGAQSQSKADVGGAGAQSQSKPDVGGAGAQSQSKDDVGGAEAQSVDDMTATKTEAGYIAMSSFQDELIPTRSKFNKSKGGEPTSPVLAKRKRNQSTGCAACNPNLATDEVSPKMVFTYEDAMNVIERLLAEGSLLEGTPLWCFGVDEMLKAEARLVFLTIPRDSGRLAWLHWRFHLAHPEMHDTSNHNL